MIKFVNWLIVDERPKVKITFTKPSLTQQQFADDCDINILVSRFKQTGSFYDPLTRWQNQNLTPPTFEDVSEFPEDLIAVNQKMQHFEKLFMELKAETRAIFGNSYLNWIRALQSESGMQQAVKMGLVRVVNPDPTQPITRTVQPPADSFAKTETNPAVGEVKQQ